MKRALTLTVVLLFCLGFQQKGKLKFQRAPQAEAAADSYYGIDLTTPTCGAVRLTFPNKLLYQSSLGVMGYPIVAQEQWKQIRFYSLLTQADCDLIMFEIHVGGATIYRSRPARMLGNDPVGNSRRYRNAEFGLLADAIGALKIGL